MQTHPLLFRPVFVALTAAAACPAAAQVVALQRNSTFNASGFTFVDDKFGSGLGVTAKRALHLAADGSVLACGSTSGIFGGNDFVLVKFKPDGTLDWFSKFNGGGNDLAYALGVDAAGAVYVCGSSLNSSQHYRFAVMKFNPDGTKAWTAPATYDNGLPARDHYGWTIAVAPAGDVYVAGQSHNGLNFDYAVVRFDTDGNFVAAARFNGGGDDFAYALTFDGAGNLLVTGQSQSGPFFNYRTLKYDAALNPLWGAGAVFNGTAGADDFAYDVTVDAVDDVYVTGRSRNQLGNFDIVTVKYAAADGAQLWVNRYNGSANGDDIGHAVLVDGADVLVAGASRVAFKGTDFTVLSLNAADGSLQWVGRRNGSGQSAAAYALGVDAAGDVYATGYASAGGTGSENAVTLKFDRTDGSVLWSRQFGSRGADYGLAVAVAGVDDLFVGGFGGSFSNDIFVLKYGLVTPTADAYAVDEDMKLEITDPALGVLANDTVLPAGALTAVIVDRPDNGTLTLNADGSFTYTPDPNFAGVDTFTYRIRDGGGLQTGTALVTITVNAINDAPVVVVPGSRAVKSAVNPLVFSVAAGNPISISDVDAGAAVVRLTLTVDQGTLTLATTTGLVFFVGDGTDDAAMTFDGTIAAINTALDGLRYTYNPAFKGVATLTVTADDLGNTPGPAQTDTDTVHINTAGQAARDLRAVVLADAAVPQYVRTNLARTLQQAASRYDAGWFASGDGRMVRFQDQVAGYSTQIPPATAAAWTAEAQAIIDATP